MLKNQLQCFYRCNQYSPHKSQPAPILYHHHYLHQSHAELLQMGCLHCHRYHLSHWWRRARWGHHKQLPDDNNMLPYPFWYRQDPDHRYRWCNPHHHYLDLDYQHLCKEIQVGEKNLHLYDPQKVDLYQCRPHPSPLHLNMKC